MTNKLTDLSPLGRSVEEVEQGDRSSSDTPRVSGAGVPAVPPAATAGLGGSGGAAVGALLITDDALEPEEQERQD